MPYVTAPDETDGNRMGSVAKTRGLIMSPEGAADYAPTSVIGTGVGVVEGTITVDAIAPTSAFAALLRQGDGVTIGYVPVNMDGTYQFTQVGAGNYGVVIVDGTGVKRAKVIHTVVS